MICIFNHLLLVICVFILGHFWGVRGHFLFLFGTEWQILFYATWLFFSSSWTIISCGYLVPLISLRASVCSLLSCCATGNFPGQELTAKCSWILQCQPSKQSSESPNEFVFVTYFKFVIKLWIEYLHKDKKGIVKSEKGYINIVSRKQKCTKYSHRGSLETKVRYTCIW